MYEEPVYEPPVYEAPVEEAPVHEEPVYEAPVYEAPPELAPEIAEPVSSETAPAIETPEAEPALVAPWNSKFLRLSLAAAAALIVIVGLFVYPGLLVHRAAKTGAPASQDTSSLALRVQHNGGEILLTWNRDSDAVRNATRAVLSISDGDRQENVAMDVAQLRIGVINYTPATSDVVFKMEVTGQGQAKTTSESIRALQMRPSPMPQPGQ